MSNSRARQKLREQRQEKRFKLLDKQFLQRNPQAARLHVIFGHPLHECVELIMRAGSAPSKRQARMLRRNVKMEEARRKLNERMALEQKRLAEQAQRRQASRDKRQKSRLDMRGALRQLMRKKEG